MALHFRWTTAIAALLVVAAYQPSAWAGCRDKPKAAVDWSGCDKERLILRGRDLQGANLERTDLSESDLSEITLKDALLQETMLTRARLWDADLRGGANLEGANLTKSEMSRAILEQANLRGVDLKKADLSRAHFAGADLTDASFNFANVARTHFNTGRGQFERRLYLFDAHRRHRSQQHARLDPGSVGYRLRRRCNALAGGARRLSPLAVQLAAVTIARPVDHHAE
jgi:hypothetical protein